MPSGKGKCGAFDLTKLELNQKRLRFVDRVTTIGLLAAMHAHSKTGFSEEETGIVLGIDYGVYPSCLEFHKSLVNGDPSPGIFPYTVPNIVGGHISIQLGIKGPGITVTGTWTAGVEAIGMALDIIEKKSAQAVLAGGISITGDGLDVFGLGDITETAVFFTLTQEGMGHRIMTWNASTRLEGEDTRSFLKRHWESIPWKEHGVTSLWGNIKPEIGEETLGISTMDINAILGDCLAATGPASIALSMNESAPRMITVVPPDYSRAASIVVQPE